MYWAYCVAECDSSRIDFASLTGKHEGNHTRLLDPGISSILKGVEGQFSLCHGE